MKTAYIINDTTSLSNEFVSNNGINIVHRMHKFNFSEFEDSVSKHMKLHTDT